MKMFMNSLVVCVTLAVLQTSVTASEVSEELLQQYVLGMQQQMETMQRQMATEKQEMQHEKNDDVQILKHQLQGIQWQMATEREEMQHQIATQREEMQQQMATQREEMQQQMATEREEMQQQVEKMQQQMATEREASEHETKERQEMQLMMRNQNNTLKENINNINVKLAKVVHENQLLGEIVSVLKQNVSLGFGKVSDMVSQAVERKHNGSFIGFSAYPSETRDYTNDVTVLFDFVVTNVGSLYTPDTSIFICGYEGYYLFSVSVHTTTADFMTADLVMGSTTIATVYADQTESDASSNTVVVLCPQFSQVYVRARNDGLTMYGGRYSMFTGLLLLQQ